MRAASGDANARRYPVRAPSAFDDVHLRRLVTCIAVSRGVDSPSPVKSAVDRPQHVVGSQGLRRGPAGRRRRAVERKITSGRRGGGRGGNHPSGSGPRAGCPGARRSSSSPILRNVRPRSTFKRHRTGCGTSVDKADCEGMANQGEAHGQRRSAICRLSLMPSGTGPVPAAVTAATVAANRPANRPETRRRIWL